MPSFHFLIFSYFHLCHILLIFLDCPANGRLDYEQVLLHRDYLSAVI